ncbi:MAG TPA: FAD/NAD(P)-binding protein [Chloroflexota bacterium]|nr:FAD/NAD(P)-binding protein [Chloroflexota bacterium]
MGITKVETRAARHAEPMLPRPFRVERVHRDTADTWTLVLRAQDGEPLFFTPGQFTMLYVFGVGEAPISISGDPARPDLLVHTVRAVGAVSRAITALRRGDTVGVRGPYGSPWPVEQAEGHDVVLVPGGIGMAPLRPALYHLLSHRERYRHITLLYGARTPADLLYRQELERWRGRLDLDVAVSVDNAATTWRGNVGVVTTLIPLAQFDPAVTVAMTCGPEVMMRFTAASLQQRGLQTSRIYLSMERNMRCAIGLCGHCQFGPTFVCKTGPVYRLDRIASLLATREV